MRRAVILVLSCNALAVSIALVCYHHTGLSHFGEQGFITKLSLVQLLAISWLAYKVARLRGAAERRVSWRDPSRLWAIIALGFLFLAADERFKIHENIDSGIHHAFRLQANAVTDRIDDVLVGLYGLAGVSLLILCRRELVVYKDSTRYLVTGFGLLFGMVLLDVLTNRDDILRLAFGPDRGAALHVWASHAEDSAKIFAEASFLLAFFAILRKAKQVADGHGLDSAGRPIAVSDCG